MMADVLVSEWGGKPRDLRNGIERCHLSINRRKTGTIIMECEPPIHQLAGTGSG